MMLNTYVFGDSFARLMFSFTVEVCIAIFVSYPEAPVSFTIAINIEINILSMVFKPPPTYLPCPGDTKPQSIIT